MTNLSSMDVRALMKQQNKTEAFSISPNAHVNELISELEKHNVSALVVLEMNGKLTGIVSERDIVRKATGSNSYNELLVADIMSKTVVAVSPNTSLDECEAFMKDNRIRHLPVVENGKVLTIVSIRDLLEATRLEKQRLIEHYEGFIQPG